jgi:hypothetical protein
MLRRFLVLVALMFWQGGFTFYAAVVVPAGHAVLRPSFHQAFVTRLVSLYLNVAGALALVLLAWDTASTSDPCARRRRWRWAAWLGMVVALAVLVWLYPRLDGHMDTENLRILDPDGLGPIHRVYLWVSTAQWACGVIYAVLMLCAWRAADRRTVNDCQH